ncbi:uncharacterized protein LOC125267036 isoform X2 [Megalobrama amblycephala]|uniref:uncharacterized protein LOC125267036 isoform X2 n=1 Tax=Megalobrama amblycephala TaxID=75352 RepID=UPI002013FD26|nr:uncharacterized protein LOC125267036 isoform X2 [Megalobrama amblycephala]
MPCEMSYFISWILKLLLFDVKFIYGLNVCRGDLITNVSLSTELQSEVLLPCSFESDLLKPNRTNESCVVWTHLNTQDFVEISLDGEAKFWNNRRGRIETFPKLPESELLDFSIRIRNVQQSDLGVYHCKLFRETNCFLAYKIIDLHKVDSLTWLIPAGSAGGAVVLLVLLIIACKFFKCKEKNSREPVYENTSNHRAKFTNEGSQEKKSREPAYENTSNHRSKFTNEGRISHSNPIYMPS